MINNYFISFVSGQDYFYSNSGQQPRYLGFQQQPVQRTSQQQLSNFFSPSPSSSVFSSFHPSPTNYQTEDTQETAPRFQPIQQGFPSQPSPFQLPPQGAATLQQFDSFPSRSTNQQFVQTNQHLRQPFHHFQTPQSNSQRYNPFEITSSLDAQQTQRFQNSPRVQKPSFQNQIQNSFTVNQNNDDESKTTQSYVNVDHPQGLIDQLSPTPHHRWRQTPGVSPAIVPESRRIKRPQVTAFPISDITNHSDDIALDTYIDQHLELDDSTPQPVVSSSPDTFLTVNRDRLKGDIVIRRKPGNRLQPGSRDNNVSSPKNPNIINTNRGTPAFPINNEDNGNDAEYTTKPAFVSRNKYKTIRLDSRVRPTTYSPPTVPGLFEKHQRNRNRIGLSKTDSSRNSLHPLSTTSSAVEENPNKYAEFGRPLFKKKIIFNHVTSTTSVPIVNLSTTTEYISDPVEEEHIQTNSDKIEPSNIQTLPEDYVKHLENENLPIEHDYDFPTDDVTEIYDEDHDENFDEFEYTTVFPHIILNGTIPENNEKHDDNSSFDVLNMHGDHKLVADDNFRTFVDSVSIDATESPLQTDEKDHDDKSDELSAISVSVHSSVTAEKSPVVSSPLPNQNETSLPNNKTTETVTVPPSMVDSDQVKAPPSSDNVKTGDADEAHPTESWVIVASVQTSRSVSGARFLPSGAVNQQVHPQPLAPKLAADKLTKDETKEEDAAIEIENQTSLPQPDSADIDNPTLPPSPDQFDQKESHTTSSSTSSKSSSPASTESIIDKLDRVQSELSSGILTGGFQPNGSKLELEVLPEMTSENSTIPTTTITTTTTPSTTTTITTTTSTTTTPKPTPSDDFPPVIIRKFSPSARRTTPKPKKSSLFDSIQYDELAPGLLPPGFKARSSFRKTTTTTSTAEPEKMQGDQASVSDQNSSNRAGGGRSTDTSNKQNKIKLDDISALLPPGYKPPKESTVTEKPKAIENILSKIKFEDLTPLLPPGYKQNKTNEEIDQNSKEVKIPKLKFNVPSNLLPPGFKVDNDSEKTNSTKLGTVDINSLLPPGFKLTTESTMEATPPVLESILKKVQFKDVAELLPPGYKDKISINTTEPTTTTVPESTTPDFKVKFPSRPGAPRKTPARAPGSVKAAGGIGPVQPKIQKGWPQR